MKNIFKSFTDIEEVEKDVQDPTKRGVHSKQRALELSIKEGAAADFSYGIGANYATPFALVLNASPFQVGILSSLSGLAAPISQLFGSNLMFHKARKKIALYFVFWQALTLVPIAFLAIAFWKGILQEYLIYAFIALFTIYTIFGGILLPAWFSWMGDLVPAQDRGKYFSIRNRAAGIASIVSVLIGAFILDYYKTKGLALIGFSIIFFFSSLIRFISYFYLAKQYAPRFRVKKSSYFSLWSFIKRGGNYRNYALYKFFFYFAMMIASPFFAVYMLEDLKFSYLMFTIVSMSSSVYYLLFSTLLGRFADRFGNVKLLHISNFFFTLTPLLWLLFKSPLYLVLVPQLISGLGNAALILASSNFTYDAVSQEKRGICIAYEGLFIGAGTFIGSLLGGVLIKYSPLFVSIGPFFVVFLISGALRFLGGLVFLPWVKEVRKTEKFPQFRLSLAHPFKTIHADIARFRAVVK